MILVFNPSENGFRYKNIHCNRTEVVLLKICFIPLFPVPSRLYSKDDKTEVDDFDLINTITLPAKLTKRLPGDIWEPESQTTKGVSTTKIKRKKREVGK